MLWEPHLVIEFPPGSLVLIPSATISHSNTPVAPGDSHSSFTQYAPGGLFRYVDYGFRLENKLRAEDPALFQEKMEEHPRRWKKGLGLLSTVEEVCQCKL